MFKTPPYFMVMTFFKDAFRPKGALKIGEIWTTHSFITTNGEEKEYGILFAADITGQFSVGIEDLGFNAVRLKLD